jgi:hypothetical protein
VKPWGWMQREIAGALRSVRYDMDRRAEERDGEPGRSDTWFTEPVPQRDSTMRAAREPRRILAAAGVASIIVASAAGTYFAVAGGLGMLIADAAGVPVVPQAVPMMPLAPIPQLADKKATHRVHVKKAEPTTAAATVASPVPTTTPRVVARPAPLPEGTSTTAPPRHTPVPESTRTVTPSNSPSASPSPSAVAASGSPEPPG